jgi:uncharacterized membrane protein YkgB
MRPEEKSRHAPTMANRLLATGGFILRYGLVVLVLWLGAFKFTETEAKAIQPLIAHSPLMSWLYHVADVRTVSRIIGLTEIVIALLVATRPFAARLSAIGSLAAIGMFATTLSFLVTTPGMFVHVEGFIVPSDAGAFLMKDIFLLGAAVWTAGEALRGRDASGLAKEWS